MLIYAKKWFGLGLISVCFLAFGCKKITGSTGQPEELTVYKNLSAKRVNLPNGWSLTPVGRSLDLDDLPLNLVVSPSKKYLAVTNNGQSTQSITLIDANTEKILDTARVAKSYLGLAFSEDEQTLYASGGNDNKILVYRINNQQLVPAEPIVLGKPWPVKISPTGIAVDDTKGRVYVVTKEDSALYICDTQTRKAISKINLGAAAYTCLLSRDKKELYVSLWGGSRVVIVSTESQKISAEIATNKNPNDLLLTRDGQYL